MINGKYYLIVTSPKTWNTAKQTCQNLGAKLFEPRNQADNDAIGARMNVAKYWIGITDRENEGRYVQELY